MRMIKHEKRHSNLLSQRPLDETNLDAVREAYPTKRFQPVRQQEELVGAMLITFLDEGTWQKHLE